MLRFIHFWSVTQFLYFYSYKNWPTWFPCINKQPAANHSFNWLSSFWRHYFLFYLSQHTETVQYNSQLSLQFSEIPSININWKTVLKCPFTFSSFLRIYFCYSSVITVVWWVKHQVIFFFTILLDKWRNDWFLVFPAFLLPRVNKNENNFMSAFKMLWMGWGMQVIPHGRFLHFPQHLFMFFFIWHVLCAKDF